MGKDDIDVHANQLSGGLGKPRRVALRGSVLKGNILALHPPLVGERTAERLEPRPYCRVAGDGVEREDSNPRRLPPAVCGPSEGAQKRTREERESGNTMRHILQRAYAACIHQLASLMRSMLTQTNFPRAFFEPPNVHMQRRAGTSLAKLVDAVRRVRCMALFGGDSPKHIICQQQKFLRHMDAHLARHA